ncbi:MAG: shikimate dehydrogenase [Beijerinckiaceae bacterium]|nr:shikimate dehydrogenase [Beijerinckiaceae bacterium]
MVELADVTPILHPVTPRTKLVPMIGHPIAQVITPEPMNRYFQRSGIDAAVIPMDIAPSQVSAFFSILRGWANCIGVSVTMPHKQAAFNACDTLSERAAQAGAVNLIQRGATGMLHGDMTDGAAFVAAITGKGATIRGSRFLLIGAGGAGAAVAHAIAEAGASRIYTIDIDAERSQTLARSLRSHHPLVQVDGPPDDYSAIDIVFNATPLGMITRDPLPLDLSRLSVGCIVADAVTKPLITPFIAAARANAHSTLTGEEMALAQLAIQLPLWGFGYQA